MTSKRREKKISSVSFVFLSYLSYFHKIDKILSSSKKGDNLFDMVKDSTYQLTEICFSFLVISFSK